MDRYTPTIGIETHVQLKTKSKLFCGCDNDARTAEPNTQICPVCMGLPGTLPVLNRGAIELAIRAGLALNGEIAGQTKFDRKNYLYPDLPKGYQITQFDQPIVGKGSVEVPMSDGPLRVGITRAHLEEDAAKLTHPAGAAYSLVDLNRAGTPLLEIVSEPDMHSPAQAKAYAQEIHNLMRYAAVSDANLYYGNMRFDVNVSLARPNGPLGTRTETKNLNSFRAIERAVAYEITRQSELLDKGETINQETRGWDEAGQVTVSQRSKEEAHDYRYFPEPDLPPIRVTEAMLKTAKNDLPLLPDQIRLKLAELGISSGDALTITGEPLLATLLLATAEGVGKDHVKRVSGWLTGEVPHLLSNGGLTEGQVSAVEAVRLVELSEMVGAGKLSSTAAKTVLVELLRGGDDPAHIAERLNLIQVSDSGALDEIAATVLAANPKAASDYAAGQSGALKFLVGQVMKESRGQANPTLVSDILTSKLKETNS